MVVEGWFCFVANVLATAFRTIALGDLFFGARERESEKFPAKICAFFPLFRTYPQTAGASAAGGRVFGSEKWEW